MSKQIDLKKSRKEIDTIHSTFIKKSDVISKYIDKKNKSKKVPIPPKILFFVKEYSHKKDKLKWLNQFPKAQQTEIKKHARYYTDRIDRDKCNYEISELQKNINDYMKILNRFRSDLKATLLSRKSNKKSKDIEKTSREVLEGTLIQVLEESGGKAHRNDVFEKMEKVLKDTLTDYDREIIADPLERWKINVSFYRSELVGNGVIKRDSPRGFWTLEKKNERKK